MQTLFSEEDRLAFGTFRNYSKCSEKGMKVKTSKDIEKLEKSYQQMEVCRNSGVHLR